MTSRKQIEKFFEDYFSEELVLKFDKNLKIKDISGFDSLEIVNLSLNFQDKFKHTIEKEDFTGDKTFSEIIDSIFTSLSQKAC
jgi:acyl carrier protein